MNQNKIVINSKKVFMKRQLIVKLIQLPLVVASPIFDNKKHVKNIHVLSIIGLLKCVIDKEFF